MNTFEYIWLDGYEPEPFLRSKVKATEDDTPPDGLLMDRPHFKQKVVALIVCYCLCRLIKIQMDMILL